MDTVVYTCPDCGGDLIPYVYTTIPPIHAWVCHECGWRHVEESQKFAKVPFPEAKSVYIFPNEVKE